MTGDFSLLITALAERFEALPEFRDRFRALDHQGLAQSTLEQVVAWRWSTRPRSALDPLEMAIRPKRERSAPKLFKSMQRNTGDEYGFDASGRQIVERNYTYFPDHFYAEYWRYEDDWIEGACFDNRLDKRPMNVARLYRTEDRPLAFIRFAIKGWCVGVYSDEKLPQRYLEAWQTYKPPLSKWGVTIRACELAYAEERLDSVVEVPVDFADSFKSLAARVMGT